MFNQTEIEEIENFIPIIGFGAFISILFICCICNKTKTSIINYQNLSTDTSTDTSSELNNNYSNTFVKSVIKTRNDEKPPPYINVYN